MPDFLPNRFEFSHGLCIWLHNELVSLAKGMELGGYLSIELPKDPSRPIFPGPLQGEELWSWLEENGYSEVLGDLYVRSLFPALLADFCPFVLEALNCSRKSKLTVTYALLRKPFREDLFYLERLLGDPVDFISRFHDRPIGELALDQHLRTGTCRNIIAAAVERTPLPELYDPELIHNLRYVKDFPDGFAGPWDQALHLITTHRPIRTDARNLNFIFSDTESYETQWAHIYTRLPYLLSYALDVCLIIAKGFLKYPLPHMAEMIVHRQLAFALWLDDCQKIKTRRATSRTSKALLMTYKMTCHDCSTMIRDKRSLRKLYMEHEVKCTTCGATLTLGALLKRTKRTT